MLDWPEATHTSPTSTSASSMVFSPFTTTVWDPPAAIGFSASRQRPSESATADAAFRPIETVTSSPGEAQPQNGRAAPRCRTMRSPSTDGSLTSAVAVAAERAKTRQPSPAIRVLSAFMASPPGRNGFFSAAIDAQG